MDDRIDIELLINEVKAQPALWNTTTEEYSNRIKKKQSWEQITNKFTKRNDTIAEKREIGQLLQKKWKNVRDRFMRKTYEKTENGTKKIVPYIYAEHLQFLKNTSMTAEKKGNKNQHNVTCKLSKKRLHPIKATTLNNIDNSYKKIKLNQTEENEDDNRQFLLSMLPSLKALPNFLNINCRIEMLQLLSKYVSQNQPAQSFQSSSTVSTTNTNSSTMLNHLKEDNPMLFTSSE